MPTPNEKKALVFLGAVALLGAGAQAERLRHQQLPQVPRRQPALVAQIAAAESARAAGGGGRRRSSRPRREVIRVTTVDPSSESSEARGPRPEARTTTAARGLRPAAGSLVDLDTASAATIERLPRIGPALAARIVADRDSLGPFGSLEELGRVRGIGPAMLRTLEKQVTFSLQSRPHPAGGSAKVRAPRSQSRAHPPIL